MLAGFADRDNKLDNLYTYHSSYVLLTLLERQANFPELRGDLMREPPAVNTLVRLK